jgi:hypothetical protein
VQQKRANVLPAARWISPADDHEFLAVQAFFLAMPKPSPKLGRDPALANGNGQDQLRTQINARAVFLPVEST